MHRANLTIVLILLLTSVASFSQHKSLTEIQPDTKWNQGSILTNDGEELKGLLRYDDRVGILNYINGDQSRSFLPRNVTAFEFLDEVTQKQRIFYSLEDEDALRNIKIPLFFEVLKDFKNFAVLSRVDPVKVDKVTNKASYFSPVTPYAAPGTGISSHTEIIQTETIFFLDDKGNVEPYIQVLNIVVDRVWYEREKKKNKYVDKDVITKYFTKEEMVKMEEYADKNDLTFRVKDDLVKILSYCEELRAAKKD